MIDLTLKINEKNGSGGNFFPVVHLLDSFMELVTWNIETLRNSFFDLLDYFIGIWFCEENHIMRENLKDSTDICAHNQ